MTALAKMWSFKHAMIASALINGAGGVALLLGLSPPSLMKVPLNKESSGYHMAMQAKGYFIMCLGIMNYLSAQNRDNKLFVQTTCAITAVGDVYYMATRLVNYVRGYWNIEGVDANIEYFGLVWCLLEFADMLYFGLLNH